MPGRWLSTGKAAQRCSVNPDTVLKWIKRGRLRATRTAGGHYRIQEGDLTALIPILSHAGASPAQTPESCERPLRCWEYLSNSGVVRDECKKCFIYQIRAAWCFRTAALGCEFGQMQNFGNDACQDCAYFRRANGHATHVLVATADDRFTEVLRQGKRNGLELRFARNAYEASAMISEFRPAFAVVDQELLTALDGDLLNCLASDPRAPGLKIILATGRRRGPRISISPKQGVVGVYEKPFGVGRIVEVVNRFPVEQAPAAK